MKFENSTKVVYRLFGNVCPICEKENTNCSYFDNTKIGSPNRYSCLTEITNHKSFQFLRTTNGFSIYSERGDNNKFSKIALSTLNLYKDQPSEDEIHEQYYYLTQDLSLVPKHALDLANRGINKDLALKLGYRTLPARHKIDFENKLSGFVGNVSTNSTPVLLIPCYSAYGRIVGYQIKTDSIKNKYIWGSGDYSAHNKAGKLPITITRFSDSPVSELWVTEGYLKATATSVKFNQVVFGCGGGTLDRTRELTQAIIELDVAKVVIFPDAGSAINAPIMSNNIRHYQAIKRLGCEVYFADYGQFKDKSVGDIDDQESSLEFKLVGIQEYQPLEGITKALDSFSSGFITKQSNQAYTGEFKAGEKYTVKNLTEAYEELVKQGVKIVHDCSATGAGKSHAVGNIQLDRMFTELDDKGKLKGKLVYAVSSPRNPTIDKIAEEFQLLEGRHNGLYQAPDGRLKSTDVGELVKDSNCKYNKLFQLTRERGTPTQNICKGCDLSRVCKKSEGDGFGYRKNYIKALASKKLITNPTSIPINYVDEDTCIIIDEFTSVNSITALNFNLNVLVGKALQAKDYQLADFFNAINSNKKDGYYSESLYTTLQASDMLSRIKTLADVEVKVLDTNEQAINRLFLEQWKSGKNNGKYDIMRDAELTIEHAYFNNLYMAFKDMKFSAFKKGTNLEISCINDAIKSNAKLAGTIIVQDATTSTQEIADFFGVSLGEVVTIELATNKASTRNIHVTGLGKITTNRSPQQIAAINALREVIPSYLNLSEEEVGFIDYGRFAKGKDLTFFSTARGSNDFASKKAIVLIGTPLTNLGAALTRYEALKGVPSSFDDDGFKEFYLHKTNEEAIQATGRLRASRRLSESLTVVVLGDAGLPCLDNMERVQACDIEPTIATRQANVDKRIRASQEYIAENGIPTQKELAAYLGLSTDGLKKWVRRHFRNWEVFLDSLVTQFEGFESEQEDEVITAVQAMGYLQFSSLVKLIEPTLTASQKLVAYSRLELLKEVALNTN